MPDILWFQRHRCADFLLLLHCKLNIFWIWRCYIWLRELLISIMGANDNVFLCCCFVLPCFEPAFALGISVSWMRQIICATSRRTDRELVNEWVKGNPQRIRRRRGDTGWRQDKNRWRSSESERVLDKNKVCGRKETQPGKDGLISVD